MATLWWSGCVVQQTEGELSLAARPVRDSIQPWVACAAGRPGQAIPRAAPRCRPRPTMHAALAALHTERSRWLAPKTCSRSTWGSMRRRRLASQVGGGAVLRCALHAPGWSCSILLYSVHSLAACGCAEGRCFHQPSACQLVSCNAVVPAWPPTPSHLLPHLFHL